MITMQRGEWRELAIQHLGRGVMFVRGMAQMRNSRDGFFHAVISEEGHELATVTTSNTKLQMEIRVIIARSHLHRP